MSPQEAPYGTWRSPISSDIATRATNEIVEAPKIDPVTGFVFWCEQISSEAGHNAVFHFNPETRETVRWTGKDYDVRTKAHEYGGGAFTVFSNSLFFSHGDDGAIYRQDGPSASPRKLTKSPDSRYADGVYCPKFAALVYVEEDHGVVAQGKAREPRNTLVWVDASTGHQTLLVANADFYATPTFSSDDSLIGWVQWNHPQMPWWETQVCIAKVADNQNIDIIHSFQNGSNILPSFDLQNHIFYVHDKTGWWNLYKVTDNNEINLTPEAKEVGFPMWMFGRRHYDINPKTGNQAVVISSQELMLVDLKSKERRILETSYPFHSFGVVYSRDGTQVYTVAGSGAQAWRLIQVQLATGEVQVVSCNSESPVLADYISLPTHICFPTTQGDSAYAYLYLPKNKDYKAPAGTKPPLLVRAHGGPTGNSFCVLNLNIQFFTSRGFAILDVNYRGSTGYGREYMNKLNGKWGILDVDDVLAGAAHLVKENLVDPGKMCIDGGSAGGFTTLAALIAGGSTFTAGASYYGVSDLEMLARETHKFESRYLDTLIGSLDTQKDLYDARSPLKNYKKLNSPMIFLQGTEDKIVLPSQSQDMYELVKSKGLPAAYILYEGEAHGFVKTDNRKSSLEAELYFFSQVFNFKLADITSNVVIENLDTWRSKHH